MLAAARHIQVDRVRPQREMRIAAALQYAPPGRPTPKELLEPIAVELVMPEAPLEEPPAERRALRSDEVELLAEKHDELAPSLPIEPALVHLDLTEPEAVLPDLGRTQLPAPLRRPPPPPPNAVADAPLAKGPAGAVTGDEPGVAGRQSAPGTGGDSIDPPPAGPYVLAKKEQLGSKGNVIDQPEAEYRPDPLYPKRAVDLGLEGTVTFLALVKSDGTVEACEIESTSGHDLLDQAARKALLKWRFKPRKVDGSPRPFMARVPFHFFIPKRERS